jgi:translin
VSLAEDAAAARAALDAMYEAREVALRACRLAIRASSGAVRACHRHDAGAAEEGLADARARLAEAKEAVRGHGGMESAGYIHDAEKEVIEAEFVSAVLLGTPAPRLVEGTGLPAFLHGACEAASELRRAVLDAMRAGGIEEAGRLLGWMDAAYEAVAQIDHPDAMTAGLRRAADALRAVVERTRSDYTATVLQEKLRMSLRG